MGRCCIGSLFFPFPAGAPKGGGQTCRAAARDRPAPSSPVRICILSIPVQKDPNKDHSFLATTAHQIPLDIIRHTHIREWLCNLAVDVQ